MSAFIEHVLLLDQFLHDISDMKEQYYATHPERPRTNFMDELDRYIHYKYFYNTDASMVWCTYASVYGKNEPFPEKFKELL